MKRMTKRRTKYTKEYLAPFVEQATNWSHLLRLLGLKFAGGTHRYIQTCVNNVGLDTSHFTGSAWNKGRSSTGGIRWADEDVFAKDSTYNPSHLHRRLVQLGWEEKCAACDLGNTWQAKPLRLHVDHINGDHSDHRLENLRFLCPNCHSQTSTFCNKGRK